MEGPAALIYNSFENISDPRVERGHNHDLLEMIFIALTASICGADGWVDVERFAKSKTDWFRRYIDLKHGVPSHDTFGRVFSRLDTGEFLASMHHWIDQFATALRGQGTAIDGKTLRGSFDQASNKSALHTLTAFATGWKLVLRQLSVEDKSNEIPAVPMLLELLDLAGAVVTLDAMHCQRETAQSIIDAEADYILTVKKNQQNLYSKLIELFTQYGEDDYRVKGLRKQTTVENSHGREELFISSLPAKVKTLSTYLRDHWKIENSQHYVLDVTFSEDASRIRKGSASEISGGFRRMALNILRQDTTLKESIRGKRLMAGWDGTILDKIYAGFNAV
ncbi:ISAs1 family transposase [Roseiconus lacunae]|uniref:ISAs1 family transposase n=1 Tax=Roseiconus lacunae TaxID=2605694 RepID=UPI001E52B9FA|nr:ISAs1 family transposase [Roseiconus lacunae]MCD0459981.1 ISAs1 family transposase [Roseiconus lacunae]